MPNDPKTKGVTLVSITGTNRVHGELAKLIINRMLMLTALVDKRNCTFSLVRVQIRNFQASILLAMFYCEYYNYMC